MPVDLEPVAELTRRSASFRVTQPTGPQLFVKIVARERRDDDLLYRAWRRVTNRRFEAAAQGTAASQVEHEALLASMAARAGVRTPEVVFAGPFGNGAGLLIQEWVPAVPIDRLDPPVDDALVRAVHRQVATLHAAGITHGDLRPASILVDEARQPWLVDFSDAIITLGGDASADEATLAETLPSIAGDVAPLAPPAHANA